MTTTSNISFGSYVQDGLRSGPSYTVQTLVTPDVNGVLVSGTYNNYGPGILFSPQNTWNITPYATTASNMVAVTSTVGAGNLTLTGDGNASTLTTDNFGNPYIQFDWPRVPQIVIAGANLAGPVNVTIFGFDWYGFPLQHTYTVQNTGSYPALPLAVPVKSFFKVTRIYAAGAIAAPTTIAVQTTNIFGLPYRVNNMGDVIAIGWDQSSDLTVDPAGASLEPLGVFAAASVVPATATTGDVRGLYAPSTAADGIKSLRFTSYLKGADSWINQQASMQVRLGAGFVAPLTPADLYGVSQYYTGSPG